MDLNEIREKYGERKAFLIEQLIQRVLSGQLTVEVPIDRQETGDFVTVSLEDFA